MRGNNLSYIVLCSLLFLIIDKYSVGKHCVKIRKFNNFVLFLL